MQTKQLKLAITDVEKGEVEAVFATLNVVDRDGDVTEPGAFEDGAAVRISAYGHGSWAGALPVGRGMIKTTETEARLIGQFFLGTAQGREHFETIKAMGELQEWSYGYDAVGWEMGEREGQRVRILKSLLVHEVSPVIVGAGIDTRTVSVKDAMGAPVEEDAVLFAKAAAASEYLRFLRTAERLRMLHAA